MSMDYVARCGRCGGLSFWISSSLPAKEIAKEVAAVIRGGRQVERMDTDDTRQARWCEGECRKAHKDAAKQEEMAL